MFHYDGKRVLVTLPRVIVTLPLPQFQTSPTDFAVKRDKQRNVLLHVMKILLDNTPDFTHSILRVKKRYNITLLNIFYYL